MNRFATVCAAFRIVCARMGFVGVLGMALVALGGLLPPAAALARSDTHASGGGAIVYIHTATPSNSIYDWTDLDNPVTNNNPRAIVFVTPNWNPNGGGGIYDNHPIGVWYHGGKWAIFNQDLTAIPNGAAFNVYALPNSSYTGVFVHSATQSNIAANFTDFSSRLSNNNPRALIIVTPNWNPNGVGGIYDNHPIGVWYHGGKWSIFNQDLAAMPVGASFNVYVFSYQVYGAFRHTADPNNSVYDWTYLNHPVTNNNPKALVFTTPSYYPNSVYNNHNIGVWYYNSQWAIFNQDLSAVPNGASFNVLAFYSPYSPYQKK
ncbi:DUF7452 domain-containing protein [Tengunoibacter tsumagoiensis]|uniref:DUF7452 domain-containing protein n=1 Tax=Tengunoibacter tsumagoiensis TaxID=2014871 RepID=A0A401ZV38_9CHLR|nr:hypothetical protein [Tengunoibacter tsumagoiensis]GCE10761.1 hypothetical protein KTT_06200 [Tengunoibacter tsumagoiensis]